MNEEVWQNGQFNELAFDKYVERVAEATFNPMRPWGEFKQFKKELGAWLRGRAIS